MIELKPGNLVALHVKAEFYNQREPTSALNPKLYEIIEIEEKVAVLLETSSSDIGKEIDDHSRETGAYHVIKQPILVLRTVFELVPLSQKIISACYKGVVMARHGDS